MTESVVKTLSDSAKIFEERNAEYKDNYLQVGKVMQILFPEGLPLNSEHDHNVYHLFSLAVVKLTRFANNYKEGHSDSLRDMINYLAMVDALQEQNREGDKPTQR